MDASDAKGSDSSYPQAPTQGAAHTPAAGTRVAMLIGIAATLSLAGFLGLRVKQALDRRQALAGERTHAQIVAAEKPPMLIVSPVATMYRPHIEVTGTLRPWRDSDIGFELGGHLVSLPVATGQVVKQGQMLALLDGSSAAAQVHQAEATRVIQEGQLAAAEDAARRSDALAASHSISEVEAQQARDRVSLSRGQLEQARASSQLAMTGAGHHAIVAPFDGLITKAPTAAGGVVQPGVALIHIEDLSRLRLSASVGEDDALLVKMGAPVTVIARDRSVTGHISAIIPSLDQATRRAPIEVEVPNDPKAPLLAWSFVHAAIEGGGEMPALRIPATARKPGSQSEVIKVVEGKAHIVHVVHALAPDGAWLVRDGLSATDVILAAPDGDVKEGDAIEKTELAK